MHCKTLSGERDRERERHIQREIGDTDKGGIFSQEYYGDVALRGAFLKLVCVCLFNTIKQNCKTSMLRESLKPQEAERDGPKL